MMTATGMTATGMTPTAATGTVSATWRAMGMQVRLVVTGQAEDQADQAEDQARRLLDQDLAELDATCSRFRPDSEIRSLTQETTQVSPLLAEAIGVALRAARLTDGDVDPTVGAAMARVGYDRDFSLVPAQGPARRLTAREVPGWRHVRLDGRTLTMPQGTELDLGATVKAWAADRSAARIASRLNLGVLVGLGGDVAVAGPPPPHGWQIRVQDITGDPGEAAAGPYACVAIRHGGLATSSTAARRWRRGGDMLHHILDPRTGLPAATIWRTVSVAAGTCADANTASTAAIIRGRAAMGWLARLGLPARLVDTSGAVFTMAGWPADNEQ